MRSSPAPETLACIRAVHLLVRDGYARPGRSAGDAVRLYQRSFNMTAPSDKRLSEDGRAGPATLASMGLALT